MQHSHVLGLKSIFVLVKSHTSSCKFTLKRFNVCRSDEHRFNCRTNTNTLSFNGWMCLCKWMLLLLLWGSFRMVHIFASFNRICASFRTRETGKKIGRYEEKERLIEMITHMCFSNRFRSLNHSFWATMDGAKKSNPMTHIFCIMWIDAQLRQTKLCPF